MDTQDCVYVYIYCTPAAHNPFWGEMKLCDQGLVTNQAEPATDPKDKGL